VGGMSNLRFSWHGAMTLWVWSPFSVSVLVAVLAVAYWYLWAEWALAGRGRRWPLRRRIPFFAGLVAVDLALQSPVAAYTADYFQAHVIQHLLLMVVAPPLLALGAPSTLLLQTSSRRVKKLWLGVLRSRPFALLTHPLVVWCAYFGVMFAFFMSSLINTAMLHPALMDAFNVLFLLSGTLYWWPLVGLDPIVHWRMGYGARMASVLIGGPPEVILGLAIMSAHAPIASMYSLASTHAGGGILWASTEFSVFGGFIPIFVQWVRSDSRVGARLDARADRANKAASDLGAPVDGRIQAAGSAPVSSAGAVVPRTSTSQRTPAGVGDARADWAQWQHDAWAAMWRARGKPVPVTRNYAAQALKPSRPDAAQKPPKGDGSPGPGAA